MTPIEAMKLIDQAVSKLHGNRNDHAVMIQAIDIVKKALENTKAGEENGPKDTGSDLPKME